MTMRRVIFLIHCFLIFSLPILAVEEEVLDWDQGIFKVQNQIYFFSDLQQIILSVEILRCLYDHSQLLKATNLDQGTLPTLPHLDSENLHNQALILEYLLKLIKVRHYLIGQETLVPQEVWKTLEQTAQKKSCLPLSGGVGMEELRPYIKGEVFFTTRFQDSTWVNSEQDLSKKTSENQAQDPTQKLSKEKKVREVLDLFMNSLLRQIHHENFVRWNKK